MLVQSTAMPALQNTYPELRTWLARLAEDGRLVLAREGVSLIDELASVSKRLERERAVLFPRPGGHNIPVVANLFADRSWIAEALDVPEEQLLQRFLRAAGSPIAVREVFSAPVQEIVHHQVDLLQMLPIPKHNEHDSGPYITAGLLMARNPRTGAQNVSIHRCQISGPNRIGVLLLPRHTSIYFRMAEENGVPLDVAIVIGVHPALLLASQAIAALDEDEMGVAGALLGKPVDVVKCISNSVRVPAYAEIVIEGRILPGTREPEGPFGEFPQYYGPRENREVIEIDLITHRSQPIFHTIVGGGYEHLIVGGVPREATLLQHLQRSFPNVIDVRLTWGGSCRFHLVVKIKKIHDGEPKNIIMCALGAHYDIKQVVVVDQDVDISAPTDVEWAIATRFQADRDLVLISGALGSKLDPTGDDGLSAKMGFDATAPINAAEFDFKRIHVKGVEDIDLQSVIQHAEPSVLTQLLDCGS